MACLHEMLEQDIEDACHLIAESMNADEAAWAEKTIRFHFQCKNHDLDDGRHYFTYLAEKRIKALVGLHHYEWGPEENVWLAWFAVHPQLQGKGLGKSLLQSAEEMAKSMGFMKLFVETYSHPDFQKALKFYTAHGFKKAGTIADYLPGSHDMIVFKKNLGKAQK